MEIDLLSSVWEASWQASLGIALLLVVRAFPSRLISGRWLYVLWMVVMVRLLLPGAMLPKSPSSLVHAPSVTQVPAMMMILPGTANAPEETAAMGYLETITQTEKGELRETQPIPAPKPSSMNMAVMMAPGWLGGAAGLALYFLCAASWLRRRIVQAEKQTPEGIAAIWRECCERFGGPRPDLMTSGAVKGPVLTGLWRMRLVLPAWGLEYLSRKDWEHIFLHELAHARRRDCWTNLLSLAALCVHWFNPLVWLAQRAIRADRELATDELVLRHLGTERSEHYAETLLRVLSGGGFSGTLPGALGIAENGSGLKRRFRRIVGYRPARVAVTVLGVALLVTVAAFLFLQKNPQIVPGQWKVETVPPAVTEYKWTNPGEVREAFLKAGRMRDAKFFEEFGKDQDTGLRPDETDANHVLETITREGDAEGLAFLLDRLGSSPLAVDWQPSEAFLAELLAGQQKEMIDAMMVRRLNLKLLEKVTTASAPTGEMATWLPNRVAEVTEARRKLDELVNAAGRSDLAKMQEMLDAGVDINATALNRWTPLNNAVRKSQPAAVKFLLEHGADPNIPKFPGWNYSPLCLTRTVEIAEMLKAAGGDVNAKLYGRNEHILTYVVRHNPTEMVKWFLDQGIDPNKATEEKYESTLLFRAGNAATAELLIAHGVPVNATNTGGETALFAVLDAKDPVSMVKVLIAHGADPNARDEWGNVPLMKAPDAATVEALIAAGADPLARNKEGVGVARFLGHKQKSNRLDALAQHGVDILDGADGQQILHGAIWKNDLETVKKALAKGVNPDAPTINIQGYPDCSAMALATGTGLFDMVTAMREVGAKDVGLLSEAAARGEVGKIRELLEAGADPNEKTSQGQTALFFATRQGRIEAMKILIEAGADPRQFDFAGFSPLSLTKAMVDQWKRPTEGIRLVSRLTKEEEVRFFQQAKELLEASTPKGVELVDAKGDTALIAAASSGNSFILEYTEGNFNHQRPDGLTPIMIAIAKKPKNAMPDAVQISDPKTGERLSMSNAAYVVDLLLAHQADPDIRNHEGKTALDLAKERGDSEIAALLAKRRETGDTTTPPAAKVEDITQGPVTGVNETALSEVKRAKIKSIVLPDIAMDGVDLKTALIQLRAMAQEADPDKQGINLVLKLGEDAEKPITLKMKSPTLEAALLEAARQSHHKLVAEAYAIAIVPERERVPSDRLISTAQK